LCTVEDEEGTSYAWSRVAILSRLSHFLSLVEIECVRNKIPYDKRAGGGFTSAKEVEDVLAYLRVAAGYDAEGKWERRIVNVPFRYIGKDALIRAEQSKNPLGITAALLQDSYLNQKQRRALYELQEIIENIRRSLRQAKDSCGELVRSIIRLVDYERHLREQTGSLTADESKLGTLEQLAWIGDSYADPKAFLTHIDTLSGVVKQTRKNEKAKSDPNKLVLSTCHRGKGLEWDYVILCDVTAGRMPWNLAFSLDEELRLLYVAVTRARKRVVVTYSASDGRDQSMFITKLKAALRDLTEDAQKPNKTAAV